MLTPILFAAAVAAAGAGATPAPPAEPPPCYDAVVRAMLVRQTPTVMPDCGPDCITVAWPYIHRIDVLEILRGKAPLGPMTALSIQHTYFVAHAEGNRLWLRRNAVGGYNLLRVGASDHPPRCSRDTPPARPYISIGGRVLDEMETAGDAAFGHQDGPKRSADADD